MLTFYFNATCVVCITAMSPLTQLVFLSLLVLALSHEENSFDKYVELVDKLIEHGEEVATLRAQLEDARQVIADLNGTQNSRSIDRYAAETYTRWGRSSCPENSSLVYDGFAAGSNYADTGAAANYLCLPKDPDWPYHNKTTVYHSLIYGAEYKTYDGIFQKLHNHDVPCAICRIPRNNVIMIPGKSICFQHYQLEYSGYLMTGGYTHAAATEYVCVDREAEIAPNSSAHNHNGKLFYFVRAKCGALKCPPYSEGKELTCVVCSFSP